MIKKIKIVILVVGLLIGVISGRLFFNKVWSPFSLNHQEILSQAKENLFLLKTYQTQGEINLNVHSKEKSPFFLNFSFTSKIDQRDIENLKNTSDYQLEIGAKGVSFSFTAQSIAIDEDFYLKITSLPSFSFFEQILSDIKNQWIKINQKELTEITGKKIEKIEKEKGKQIIKEVKELLKKKKVFQIIKNLGEEKTDGTFSYHYLVTFNKEELKDLIGEFFRLMEKYLPPEQKMDYRKNLEKFNQNFSQKFDELYKKIGEINFEIWITKKNFYLKRIKTKKEIDLTLFKNLKEELGKLEEGKIKIGIDLIFSQFNQDIKIIPPQDFKSIDELFSSSK